MKKRILKKIFPIQYLYPDNRDIFQVEEDYYTIFEGQIDGTNVCFYNRNKSVIKKTKNGGKTYEDTIEFENPSFFTAIDCTFEDIKEQVVSSNDGMLEWIE